MRARVRSRKTVVLVTGRCRRPRRVPTADRATVAASTVVNVARIVCNGRTFRLWEPISITVRRRGPYYFAAYESLDIVGYGRNRQRALASFADVFSATWDWIAAARDSELARDARELKRKLRDLVAAVDTE